MAKLTDNVLMITPFHKTQRGNILTSTRIMAGLKHRGYNIDLLSLEENDWQGWLKDALDKSRYSMVHGFHALYFGQVLQMLPQIRSLPLILTTTGTDLHYDMLGKDRNIILDAMDSVQLLVVFNEDSRRNLQSEFPAYRDKLVIIPQGVFLERGKPKTPLDFGLLPENIVFLLPSGLRPVKNIELAIKALAKVHQEYPVLRLLIIGAVIDKQYSLQIAELIHGLDWVIYLGEVSHADMRGILSLGDVVVNTSLSEGQPQAVLEAMSLGKPCILTAVPGNLNLIAPDVEGIYVADEPELISAAKALICDPAQRLEMGNNARKLAEREFTLERELDGYSLIYRQMLEQS